MKRKAVSLMVICALLLSFAFPTVGFAANDYSYIRVRLVSMGSPTSVKFVVKGAYRIVDQPGVDLYPGVTYTMNATDAGLTLCYNNGLGDVAVNLPAKVNLKQYANGSATNYLYVSNTKYGWRYYPGDMQFEHLAGKTYLQMINNVFFETYLYGVVAYEMSNGWPVEALKAQAVCARTYSLRYMKSNYSAAAHIGDTSANQVYKGMPLSSGVPQARIVEAVNGTRGRIITIGTGLNPADGVFSASNGGRVRTKSEHWGGANAYHVAKDDPYDRDNSSSPKFIYVIPRNPADLSGLSATDAKKAGTMLGLLKTAVAQQVGGGCTADNVTITAINRAYPIEPNPAGSYENTKVRFELNYSLNMTPTPTPTPTPEPTPTPTPEPVPTPTGEEEPTPDPSATEQQPDESAAAGGGASPEVLPAVVDLNYDVGDEVLRTAFASYNSLINTGNMWNLYGDETSDARFIYLTARGYGHGVGLSQRGAQQMANAGLNYEQILDFYYNINATSAEYYNVAVTERPLDTIPGNGASALFATLNAEIKVRAAAADGSAAVATLPQGGRVELLGSSGDWYRVLYAASGVVGWACAKSGGSTVIQPDAPSPTPTPAPTLSPVGGKARVSSYLSLRKTASSRAKTLAKIPKNGQMTVLQVYKTKSWLKVSYKGKTGYVMSKYVTVAGNKSYKAGTVTAKTLTVRSGAGTKYGSLGKLKSGETVVVTKSVKVKRVTWYRIQYMGKTGYVEAKYIRKGS